MNNRLKKLAIVFFTFLFAIFLLKSFFKRIELNKSDITNMNIVNYIPNNYNITILSNSTNNNIKKYLNENISEKKRDELNIIKDSIISYLGFNLKEKIEAIYDNEFALSFFENKLNKIDILIIFKLKDNKDINNIINTGEELNKSDQIIELKRVGKLNYISHIFLTKDKYIIASSNRELIDSSLQSNNASEILSRKFIPDDINLNKIKLLSISQYINPKHSSESEPQEVNKLITIINSEDNKIKLRSFSPNTNKINTKILNNQIDNIKDIIFTNKYSPYKQNINFLYNDINKKEFIEEISQEVNEELLFITNNNNWVLCFKNELPNKISIDQFNFLKKYKREDLHINDINYSIYINERLKIKDNNIIYAKENPIFSLQDDLHTYISNNFDALLNITEKTSLSDKYLNDNDAINQYKYILNDIFFIKQINNEQLTKYYKSLKDLQYFFNSELFSFENINININQTIPEIREKVYIESNLKLL
tara:strand:+ start:548 stop:1990 length:1443 start_codon:yes stop_codon:yes gene_type:complete